VEVEIPDGEPIKEYAKTLDIPFGCEHGICGTCIVTVEEGMENLSEKNRAEKEMHLADNQRLCCQIKIQKGNVIIKQ
jgi:ferredoxin